MKKTTARQKKFVAALGLHLLSHRLDLTAEKFEKDGDAKSAYEVDKMNFLLRKAMDDDNLYEELAAPECPVADILEEVLELSEEQQGLLEEALYGEEAEGTPPEATGEEFPESLEVPAEEPEGPPEEFGEEPEEKKEASAKPAPAKKTAAPEQPAAVAQPEPPKQDDSLEAKVARAKARASERMASLKHRRPSIADVEPPAQPRRASYRVPAPEPPQPTDGRKLRVRTLR